MQKTSSDIGLELAKKTLRELGLVEKNGKLLPISSRKLPYPPINPHPPFHIPALEKTQRQAQSTQGYKASAHWQTASLLRDLIVLYLEKVPVSQFRRKTQLEDAARSLAANIEEGWARPTTKECLDYLGFSQGSLAEIRGDVERLLTDGLIQTGNKDQIPTPSRNFPYPPVNSRINPQKYGRLRDRLREYTGQQISPENISYEILYEFINKTDYLLTRAVKGLQQKLVNDEAKRLNDQLKNHWNKNW